LKLQSEMKILETQARLGTRYRTKTNKTKHQQLKGCATQVHLIKLEVNLYTS